MGSLILEDASAFALILAAMAITTGIGFLALQLVVRSIGQKLRPRT